MKKIFALLLALMLTFSLCACNMNTAPSAETTEPTVQEATTQAEPPAMTPAKESEIAPEEPVNILELAKKEVHDALFREQNDTTLKVVNRLFKNMEYVVVDSQVDGDEAIVTMWIMNINAGDAWVRTLEDYASLSVENMLTNKQMTSEELYETYLEELEDSFKAADMVIIPVVVEMEFENYQWVWDFDDDVINAITGNLLAAVEGDLKLKKHFYFSPTELEEWTWDLNQIIKIFNDIPIVPIDSQAIDYDPSWFNDIVLDPECLPTN